MRNHTEWFPRVAEAGVRTVRLFPEWRTIEPRPDEWNWAPTDALLKAAGESKLEINAVLMGSHPTNKNKIHAFPMEHLPEWSKFVGQAVKRYEGQINYWEVWNEGNGGFNDEKHTNADYARLAAATYKAAKAANPKAQIGLTVASYDAAYLRQTIIAQNEQGTPNHFDFLAIHPYELADRLAEADGEISFLWMTRLLRDALKAHAPERANAEIWMTEISRRLSSTPGHEVTAEQAAGDLVKIYTMALAQGIARTQWFEAQDPVGEDQGFGLIDRAGKQRAAYDALKTLSSLLGPRPEYLGWVALGEKGQGYGFVFRHAAEPEKQVLVAWTSPGHADKASAVPLEVALAQSLWDRSTIEFKPGEKFLLSSKPVVVTLTSRELRLQARKNATQPFPWGGNHAQAKTVSIVLGENRDSQGILPVGQRNVPTIRFPDGTTGVLLRGDQGANFSVHPSFGNLQTREYYVRVTMRRIASGNVGFNINYAAADSQGRTPYKNRGIWFSAKPDMGWQTQTWHLTDACFSKMWGYDFSFRPEQSVPFVIGKVEVSTEPFR